MEKVRKIARKEDGFTLVELLAVIVILGIIVAIAIPAVGNVIDNSKIDAAGSEYDMVLDAARIYFTAENPDSDTVLISDLEDGYLEQRGDGLKYVELTDSVERTKDATTGAVDYSIMRATAVLSRPTRDTHKVDSGKVVPQ